MNAIRRAEKLAGVPASDLAHKPFGDHSRLNRIRVKSRRDKRKRTPDQGVRRGVRPRSIRRIRVTCSAYVFPVMAGCRAMTPKAAKRTATPSGHDDVAARPPVSIRVRGSAVIPARKRPSPVIERDRVMPDTYAIVSDNLGEEIATMVAAHPIVDYEFAALPPMFTEPVNYWENGTFDMQTLWLLQKRDQCIKDLHALRLLLDDLRSNPPVTKIACEDAFGSTLRQASGAFSEIEHIESLLALIHPTFDFAHLPAIKSDTRKRPPIPRRSYYTEVRNVP